MAFFFISAPSIYAQKTCCSTTQQFAALGTEADFRNEHQVPKAVSKANNAGSWVEFSTADERNGRGYFIKSAKPSTKYLFVFHEWWGLNDYIMNEVEHWSKELPGVNVIALDLYDGKVATTREAASEFMQAADELRIRSIIQGAAEWAGGKAEIATIGWCFGGGWSMQTALQIDNQAIGCVIYYGMPEQDSTVLKGLNCKVLGIFAENDKWINRKVVGQYEQAMNALKKPYDTYWYKADHAFANPSNPIFNEAASEDAFQKTRQFLHQVFE